MTGFVKSFCKCFGNKKDKKTLANNISKPDKEDVEINMINYDQEQGNVEIKRLRRHLICDDAFSNRLVLRKYLELYECEVDEAENGQDAIDLVKKGNNYNIIWMDIKMPVLDGFEATDKLRKSHYKGTIIGLTGYVDDSTVRKCFEVGMNQIVSKPFDTKVIRMYVEKHS